MTAGWLGRELFPDDRSPPLQALSVVLEDRPFSEAQHGLDFAQACLRIAVTNAQGSAF